MLMETPEPPLGSAGRIADFPKKTTLTAFLFHPHGQLLPKTDGLCTHKGTFRNTTLK